MRVVVDDQQRARFPHDFETARDALELLEGIADLREWDVELEADFARVRALKAMAEEALAAVELEAKKMAKDEDITTLHINFCLIACL